MVCPNCAAPLAGAPALCPRCGHPILEYDRTVRLSFDADTVKVLGWLVLIILSAIVIVPLPWTLAAVGRSFFRKISFSDHTTVEFTGRGLQILGWMLLCALVGAPRHIFTIVIPVPLVGATNWSPIWLLGILVHLLVVRWMVRHLELREGPPLQFAGSYWGFLGYDVVLAISVITIIGWAWVLASYYQWLAENVRGEGMRFECGASGGEILWRVLVAILGSIPLVTIPWVLRWYTRWLVGTITMVRGVSSPDGDAGVRFGGSAYAHGS